jgi:hypothetical protein
MVAIPKIPNIADEDKTPLVAILLEILRCQSELIQALRDEVARLKGEKGKPKITPSSLEGGTASKDKESKDKGRRAGSDKRSKLAELQIHETVVLKPDKVPRGSKFKEYVDYTVQGVVCQPHNTRYRRERWETPEGESIVAPLPQNVILLDGGHFDISLIRFVLYLHYHAHVTQPLLLELLNEMAVDISAGQIHRILTVGKEGFHAEKDEVLRVALEVSTHINVDDTGARHQGKNGYCLHIGNELFAWFQSTASKSRINFLEQLRAGHTDYVLNEEAIEYMRENALSSVQIDRLLGDRRRFADKAEWLATLAARGITKGRHVRIATEGALVGSILEHGMNPKLVVVSDDAGQFNVLLHALCWIHAERTIKKLVGFNQAQSAALEKIQTEIWDFYKDLKAYRKNPSPAQKAALETRFDRIFTTQTCFETLNQALKRLHGNKAELLLVLDRPDIPLHNNLSETDIREYVKKRKVSGGTRSELGRRCRDTFASLKKTCRKLGQSFWQFLNDRLSGAGVIPPLPDLIRQAAAAPVT